MRPAKGVLKGKLMVVNTYIKSKGDFPGGPVVKTPCSQCRGHGFNPWSGN